MAIPNIKLTPNNVSKTAADSVFGKSSTFLDSYIYAKNSRYNALYEKNKEILQIENYAINKQNAEYLYDAFMEHVRVLETVVTRMRNFSFRIRNDVLSNLISLIPDGNYLDNFEDAISKTVDMPNFRYVHYKIKPIDYANLSTISTLFTSEIKELSSKNIPQGGSDGMPHAKCTEFIKSITKDYKTSYDSLLNMEEVKVMTPARRNIISNFYRQKTNIISIVQKDFRTYHIFLKQFGVIIKNCEKLDPTITDSGIIVNGAKMTFTEYLTIYKHFSTMMKDLLDVVSHYDNLFYNKLYALQSNIEVYNAIAQYSINYMYAKFPDEELEESVISSRIRDVLMEAYWDGYINSDEIDAHSLINGNNATQELLWDSADDIDEDDEFLGEMTEPLEEGVTGEKVSSFFKDKYLTIMSYIKDIYRKWVGIETIHVSAEEQRIYHEIIAKGKIVRDELLEILRTGKPISYESKYDEFLSLITEFKKAHKKNDEKDKEISISTLHDEVNKLERALHESTKSKVEHANKFRTALWVVISRSLYVVNVLLYNASGKGQGKSNSSVKKEGIESKRYGKKGNAGLRINNLDKSDVTPLLEKLRNCSSYNEHKKLFDQVCEMYKKEDISALKLLDLKKHNKLVFVGYKKLKPMIIKAGTKLYHISPSDSITALEPKFKSKDNITFYHTPRIYFTDKFCNPKKVLGNVENPSIYEFTVDHDIEAYRDSEYGSWYHNCIYIESDKPISVKNITSEVIKEDPKPVTESIEWQDYFDLSVLNESIQKEFETVKDEIDEADKGSLGCTEAELKKVYTKFDSLSDEEKKKKTPLVIKIISKVLDTLSYVVGIGMVRDSIVTYKKDKQFMKDIKTEMPMNHETYNKIYNAIFFKAILRIVLSILVSILAIGTMIAGLTKTSISDLKNVASKATSIGTKMPECKSITDNIVKTISKILPMTTVVESVDCINIYDGYSNIELNPDTIDGKEIPDGRNVDVETEDTAWLQDTGEEVGPLCTVRSSIMS